VDAHGSNEFLMNGPNDTRPMVIFKSAEHHHLPLDQ